MEQNSKKQIFKFIKKSENILVALEPRANGDALGSSLAFYLFLKKLGKNVNIISANLPLEKFNFLPSYDKINKNFKADREYIISIDIPQGKLNQLYYKHKREQLKIYLKPKNIELNREKISLQNGNFNYDLIVVCGIYDLEMLGSLYEENAELFFETPIMNIDNHSSNEYFGKVNLVEITAGAVSQILSEFLFETQKDLIDANIATCLLTGIISETKSFQAINTTPKALEAAAKLITLGAKQQEIIRYLYKTKSLNYLKLWGRLMARLRYDSQFRIIWSLISQTDFQKTQTNADNLNLVTEELIKNSPEANLCLIFWESAEGVQAQAQIIKNLNLEELQNLLGGSLENNKINFKLGTTDIVQAEKQTLEKIKNWLKEKNSRIF
jgi:nanoRNase/pAp phosphatase (c-di-AMP/oligoRNAs hydrolase)